MTGKRQGKHLKQLQPEIKPIPFTPERLVTATGGELLCGRADAIFKGVSINSRDIGKDDLFVAIKGENHDGHDFIEDVVAAGIKGVVIQKARKGNFDIKSFEDQGITCLAVDDTVTALGALAASQRIESGVRLIAVTGSNGKTSTRAMAESIFRQVFRTHSTSGNFNNEIGLPLTLLKLDKEHEWAIVELGMNAPGEIERLCRICRPDIGIITNAGAAHLEGLGSVENVARAKGELLPAVPKEGTVIVSSGMPLVNELVKTTDAEICYFGDDDRSLLRAMETEISGNRVRFILSDGKKSTPVALNTPGLFMVSNALAAATAAYVAGIDTETIRQGLEMFSPVKGRINLLKGKTGCNLIDDTYNANPDSMMAAVKTLKSLKGYSKGYFIMGDMKELGSDAGLLHKNIGAFAAEEGIEELCATGDYAEVVAEGAQNAGLAKDHIFTGSKKEIIKTLLQKLKSGDWVLVKGSRTMGMEEIIEGLL